MIGLIGDEMEMEYRETLFRIFDGLLWIAGELG